MTKFDIKAAKRAVLSGARTEVHFYLEEAIAALETERAEASHMRKMLDSAAGYQALGERIIELETLLKAERAERARYQQELGQVRADFFGTQDGALVRDLRALVEWERAEHVVAIETAKREAAEAQREADAEIAATPNAHGQHDGRVVAAILAAPLVIQPLADEGGEEMSEDIEKVGAPSITCSIEYIAHMEAKAARLAQADALIERLLNVVPSLRAGTLHEALLGEAQTYLASREQRKEEKGNV